MNEMNVCCQQNCPERAILTVYWPGKVPPPIYCKEHADTAVRILNAMGISVHIESIGE